jgi:hypothetical protein
MSIGVDFWWKTCLQKILVFREDRKTKCQRMHETKCRLELVVFVSTRRRTALL